MAAQIVWVNGKNWVDRSTARRDQRAHCRRRQRELLGQQPLDHGPLGAVEIVVHARRLDQQRRHGERQLVGASTGGGRPPAGEKVQHPFDHAA
jgi:hypothetical protein